MYGNLQAASVFFGPVHHEKWSSVGFGSERAILDHTAAVKTSYWLEEADTDLEQRNAFIDAFLDANKDVVHDALNEYGGNMLADVVRLMESVERFDDGVQRAQCILTLNPHSPIQKVEANRALGRCHAKLGRFEEAEAAFKAAATEAVRVGRPFHEMLARCDYIEHVLDPAGRRAEQLPLVGKAISALVLDPSEYGGVLGGYGLDVATAVAAHEALSQS